MSMMNTTTMKLFAAATTKISAALFAATNGRAARLAYIRAFNNVCDVAWTRATNETGGTTDAYTFRGTYATALGVARAGFDVYVQLCDGPDLFVAVRTRAVEVVS